MAFRADDAARIRLESAEKYLTRHLNTLSDKALEESKAEIRNLAEAMGPVVDGYPIWHPLVSRQPYDLFTGWPNADSGFVGLDHTVAFRDGFVTCPYPSSGKVEKLLHSVASLPRHPLALIRAEILDVSLYREGTKAIKVQCDWLFELDQSLIPTAYAIPLMLEQALTVWRDKAGRVDTRWEHIRPYLLGEPHGGRSSLFVGQETGQAMKKMWQQLVDSGMFGQV